MVYTITVPFQAPNKQAAEYFLLLLYSPIGQKILEENGIVPIIPGIVYGNYSAVPNAIKPFVAPLSQYPQYASIFQARAKGLKSMHLLKRNIFIFLILLVSIFIFSILIIYPLALLIVLGLPMIPRALSVISFIQAIEVTVVMSTLSAWWQS